MNGAELAEIEHRLVRALASNPGQLDLVPLDASAFLDPRWGSCLDAMQRLAGECKAIDPSIVAVATGNERLRARDLAPLASKDGVVEQYAGIIAEESSKRRLCLTLAGVLESRSEGATAGEMLTATCEAIRDASQGEAEASITIGELIGQRFKSLASLVERKQRGEEGLTGIPTGIFGLDEYLQGLQPGIVTLLAARPSMGKSAVALNVCESASAAGHGVHIFSLEDTRDSYADRALSYHSGVSSKKIRAAELSRGDLVEISRAANTLHARKGWIVDDRSGVTAEEIVRCARRKAAENGTKLVVVDYIQLLKGKSDERQMDMLRDAINVFGDAAKADSIAYLVLSQLNRSCETRDDKRPMMSDLRESGALEERSKAIVMVYREAAYNESADPRRMQLLVRKNSNGECGVANVDWNAGRMKIT